MWKWQCLHLHTRIKRGSTSNAFSPNYHTWLQLPQSTRMHRRRIGGLYTYELFFTYLLLSFASTSFFRFGLEGKRNLGSVHIITYRGLHVAPGHRHQDYCLLFSFFLHFFLFFFFYNICYKNLNFSNNFNFFCCVNTII